MSVSLGRLHEFTGDEVIDCRAARRVRMAPGNTLDRRHARKGQSIREGIHAHFSKQQDIQAQFGDLPPRRLDFARYDSQSNRRPG